MGLVRLGWLCCAKDRAEITNTHGLREEQNTRLVLRLEYWIIFVSKFREAALLIRDSSRVQHNICSPNKAVLISVTNQLTAE